MFNRAEFEQSKIDFAQAQNGDLKLKELALQFTIESDKYNWAYQWEWLGMPIIQMPADILVTQELIWRHQPDVIIETGIAWGGSIVFYASILQLIGKGKVIGIDTKVPDKNVKEIMKYPFSNRIQLIKGSSIDTDVVARVKSMIPEDAKVMVLLDADHAHQHVLTELQLYGPMVTRDQYLVVSDTIVEDVPIQTHRPRHWGPGNNPKTALKAYLKETDRFVIDSYINAKTLSTYTPDGFLKCIK